MSIKETRAYQQFTGSNADSYTGQGRIWEIAARHNKQSIAINGNVTSVHRRVVSKDKYEPVGLK
jgi:hypothetical protein